MGKLLKSMLFIFMGLILTMNLNAQTWNLEPIHSERANTMIISPSGDNMVTLFNRSGGLWRSHGSNHTSVDLFGNEVKDTSGKLYQLSPDGANILLSSQSPFGYGRFYKSHDSGNSWDRIECIHSRYYEVFVHPDNSDHMFLWSEQLLLQTTDGLSSTQEVGLYYYPLEMGFICKSIFMQGDDILMLCIARRQGEFISDYVVRWDSTTQAWDFGHPLFILNDALDVNEAGLHSIEVLSNGDILASLIVDSADNMEQFRTGRVLVLNSDWQLIDRAGEEFYSWYYPQTIIEDIANPGTVFLNCMGLYKSTDYGRRWAPVTATGIQDAAFQNTTFYRQPQSLDMYMSVAGYPLLKTEDGGSTWTEVDFPKVSKLTGLTKFQNNIVFSSVSSAPYSRFIGNEWEHLPVPQAEDTRFYAKDIFYCNGDTIFGLYEREYLSTDEVTKDPALYKTTDFGESWTHIEGTDEIYIDSYLTEYGVNLLTTPGGGYLREISTDLGETWFTVSVPSFFHYLSDEYVYGLEEESPQSFRLVRYHLFDHEWEQMSLRLPRNSMRFMRTFGESILVVDHLNNCHWYRNGSWSSLGECPDHAYNDVIVVESEQTPYIFLSHSNFNFLKYSDDMGRTFQWLDSDVPEGYQLEWFTYLSYDEDNGRIWAGTNAVPMWFSFESFLSSDEKPIQLTPADPKLLTNYPNPFNASTRIQYHLAQPGNVQLDVYDITGRWIKTLKDTYQPAGIQSVFLDGTNLSSGTYLINLQTSTENRSRKITLIK